MILDLRTLALITCCVNLLFLVFFSVQFRQYRQYNGSHCLILSFLFLDIASILVLFRDTLSSLFVSILLTNIVYLASFLCLYAGTLRFLGQKENRLFIGIVSILFLLGFINYTYLAPNFSLRSVLILSLSALVLLNTTRTAFALRKNNCIPPLLVMLALAALFQLGRAVILATTPSLESIFDTSNSYSFLVLGYILAHIGIALSVFHILNRRLIAQMKEARDKFENLFQIAPDAMIITRMRDGLLTEANLGFAQLTGFTLEETVGKTSAELRLWTKPADRERVIEELLSSSCLHNLEFSFRQKNGLHITGLVSARMVELRNENHIFLVVKDITERRQKEKEIQRVNCQLQELNASKDKFFSIMSHDLRGPLGTIATMIDHLSENLDSFSKEQMSTFVHTLSSTTKNTYKLLENLLEWSRLQTGSKKPNLEEVNMITLINTIRPLQEEMARQKQISMEFFTTEPPTLRCDQEMTGTILRNLLSNAIKYSFEGGRIEVGFQVEGNSVCFSVSDNGVGISKEALEKIFHTDTSVSTKGTHNEIGTGLGLILCKELVEAQGGQIRAESEERKGSCFYFTLPVAT